MHTPKLRIKKNLIYTGSNNRKSVLDVQYLANGKNKPIIVFAHGFKGYKDWGCFPQMGAFFAQRGFNFLSFNFSHNGGTVADPIDFPDLEAFSQNNFSKELFDLDVILQGIHTEDWLPTAEKNTDEIYLLGHSRGGGIVMIKAAKDARIKKVATLAAVADFDTRFKSAQEREIWREKGVYYIENGRTKQQMPLNYQFWEDYDLNRKKLDIPKAVRDMQKPQLIVHGQEDPTVPISEARSLKKWNPQATLLEIPHADHTFGAKQPWEQTEFPPHFLQALQGLCDFYKKD